jgi:tRNA uridine 5-carboxymethylaminomethyl modification enzyme
MGGIMAEVIGATGIQFHLLNRSRGPAVQSPRAQADRNLYRTDAPAPVGHRNLSIIEGEVAEIKLNGDRVTGVELADGTIIEGRAVVLTTDFSKRLIRRRKEDVSSGPQRRSCS